MNSALWFLIRFFTCCLGLILCYQHSWISSSKNTFAAWTYHDKKKHEIPCHCDSFDIATFWLILFCFMVVTNISQSFQHRHTKPSKNSKSQILGWMNPKFKYWLGYMRHRARYRHESYTRSTLWMTKRMMKNKKVLSFSSLAFCQLIFILIIIIVGQF